jgi:uncharacterized protein (TIGR00304 family)
MVGDVRVVRLVGPAIFLVGVVFLAVGFIENQATLNLFVIFPVVTATGWWAILGIVLMIVGLFLSFLTWSAPVQPPPTTASAPQSPSTHPQASPRRWGGVVFLGPIPLVFGSDQKVTQWMMILGAFLFVALLVLTVVALWGI